MLFGERRRRLLPDHIHVANLLFLFSTLVLMHLKLRTILAHIVVAAGDARDQASPRPQYARLTVVLVRALCPQ